MILKTKEISALRGRRLKKRVKKCLNLKKINLHGFIYYSRLHYFMYLEKIIVDRKILVCFLNTERGSVFSLKKWFETFSTKSY
uniref:Ribosomal protein L20 n=1 Tax=Caulacanthus okamurae TaxID=152008 RepID=A0A6H1U7G3_9FLOR|nr:ribosomal protein L20 [Caulacanthus okamurae]QIZ74791.1 ribosomal protein L20 [Caulacanthus okamurae]